MLSPQADRIEGPRSCIAGKNTMVVAKRPVEEAQTERTVEQKRLGPKWLRKICYGNLD
jgi:hypothetical protein